MRPQSENTPLDAELRLVARSLYQRGSIDEAVAVLRGALARDPGHASLQALLDRMVSGELAAESLEAARLDLDLVDRWIRRGWLVEALALLGGTPMGSAEVGREWANLLGELLAPVPVDVEPTLVEMHRQLLTGGGTVALTLLDERARRSPGLPSWAQRRLDLMHWMFLDNASAAEPPAGNLNREAPTELAAVIRQFVSRGDLAMAADAARRMSDDNPDAAHVARALDSLADEVERQSELGSGMLLTIPMNAPAAAALQLRMGNVELADDLYRALIQRNPEDERLRLLHADLQVLMNALDGHPIAQEEIGLGDEPYELTTRDADLILPNTAISRAPSALQPLTTSVAPMETLQDRASDLNPTQQTPNVELRAAALEDAGQLVQAAELYEALAHHEPTNPRWATKAQTLRDLAAGDEVVVREIVPVE